MAIRVVCFDIGGVLVHVATTWEEAMQSAGLTPSPKAHGRLDGFPAFDLFQEGQLSIEAYLDELSDYLDIPVGDALLAHDHILMDPTAGTIEIVRELNAAGWTTACLSNTNSPHWSELLRPERFPNIAALQLKAASQELGYAKPDARIFRAFEELAGARPDEIIFFEDGPANIAGAQACGWNAIHIDPRASQQGQIRAALDAAGVNLTTARR